MPENALKVLGLNEEEASDKITLEERYNKLWGEWNKRIEKVGTESPLYQNFINLRNQVEVAYITLTNVF